MRLAVWARTKGEAADVIRALGATDAVAVGNRSGDSLRGLTIDKVIILPGADSEVVQRNLHICMLGSGNSRFWLDLR